MKNPLPPNNHSDKSREEKKNAARCKAKISIAAGSILALILYVSAPSWMPEDYIGRLDFVALALVILAALPWMVQWIQEFEFLGFKATFRILENQVGETREMLEELTISGSASGQEQQPPEPASNKQAKHPDENSLVTLRRLAEEYVSIRDSMSSGPERTAKMTYIFGQLERKARELGSDGAEVIDWLSHKDAGLQLAAIAWLRTHPDQVKPCDLIATIDNSSQPFVQYWGLRVLKRHVDQSGITHFAPRDLRQLKRLEQQIRRGTDRYYQIRRINEQLHSDS